MESIMKRAILILGLALVAGYGGMAHADDAARKACTDAMNADPTFAEAIVSTMNAEVAAKFHNADIEVEKLHQDAAARVATNEKHVILAYAAMWLAAVAFLLFLWRRQQGLKDQIAKLTAELDKALRDEAEKKT
jgi:hypothetical protein